ncbi:MAG TPA: GntR family transcriptional regulator [Thermomicrobiales bacterium]|nr:GntR family transcriptional regulator [Thermomicrobiales bacterium]
MFDERSPIYRQIADQIKGDILSGALAEEEQVMSTNQYASFYRINPATAAKAFQQLVDEGILYKKRGIGMFVAMNARTTLLRQDRECFFTEFVDPMVAKARAIEIPLAEVIGHIQRLAKEEAR